jgi:hypothetical protein
MKPITALLGRPAAAGLALLALGLSLRAAAPAAATATVEELYAGETADTGPQYLLLPGVPREKRWVLWSRADFSWTDNATFVDKNPSSTNITSWQAGLDAKVLTRDLAGGRLTVAAGGRGQIFRYGLLGENTKIIDFQQVERNNFDLLGAGLRETWQRGAWLATSGQQGALMRNRRAGRTFYRELAWDVGLYRQWRWESGAQLLVGGEVVRHWTWTDTYGLLPSSWNDRLEGSLSAAWSQPVLDRLVWRTTVRVLHAGYNHAGRHRTDENEVAGTELLWKLHERWELRLFLAYDRRDSNEPGVSDYRRWEAGSGAGLNWEF